MVSGMACYLTFVDAESESRFKRWVLRGNERSSLMGHASLHLRARLLKICDRKFLFVWDHVWLFSFSFFLRFMLWFQLRKVRKSVTISRVRRLDFIDLVVDRGLKD